MISDKIAAVVIGRNEGERLVRCLRSVGSKLSCVVYVDSGSTDGSVQAAEGLGALIVGLTADQPYTAARARNEGSAAVKAFGTNIRMIQFIDGDCELVDGWLDTAVEFMNQRNDVAIVCGRLRELYPSASVYNRLCDLEWDTPVGEATACGGISLVRVEAIDAVAGFRAQLIAGEEPELCVRLRQRGWKIWRLDAEMARHDAAMMRFGQWWVRAVRNGHAFIEVSRLHWHSPLGIWKREVMRTVLWSGVLPLFIGFGALIYPATLGAMVIYPLQICRVAMMRGPTSSQSWSYGFFNTVSKFAEFQGIMKYYWRNFRRQTIELIEYK